MSELPRLEGQIRVLVLEEDMVAAHPILARCTEAGMDTRYAPPGVAALEAVRAIQPHLILLSVAEPEANCLRLAERLQRESAAPILVLTTTHTNIVNWQGISRETSHFMARGSSAQAILEHITALIHEIYHQNQLMVDETPSDTTVAGLPKGWGKCQSCAYIGPRTKFVNPNPLARHSLTCPVCKHFDDIVFSVS